MNNEKLNITSSEEDEIRKSLTVIGIKNAINGKAIAVSTEFTFRGKIVKQTIALTLDKF